MELDLCAQCGDAIQYVHLRNRYASATVVTTPFVCPTTGGDHEPSYSVG